MIATIGGNAFALFAYLCEVADDNRECEPSYSDMQSVLGFSRSTISRALQLMLAHQLIEIKKRFNGTSVYTINSDFVTVVQKMDYSSSKVQLLDSNTTTLIKEVLQSSSPTTELLDESPVITPYTELFDTFVNKTYLQPNGLSMPKWNDSLNRMLKVGVTPDVLSQAVDELSQRGYTLTGPWSVENACANVMRRNFNYREEVPSEVYG